MLNEKTLYNVFRKLYESRRKTIDDPKVINVTDVTGCLRRSFYNRIVSMESSVNVPDADVVKRIIGILVHEALASSLKEAGFATEASLAIDIDNIKLVGRVDILCDDCVADLKVTDGVPDKPLQSHVMQVVAYMKMAKVRRGYIVYIDRRSGRIKVFTIRYNELMWNTIVKRVKELAKALQAKKPPRRERGPWCNTCEWKWFCLR